MNENELVSFVNAIESDHGATALHLACQGNRVDVCRFILNKMGSFVDVSIRDFHDDNAEDIAWEHGFNEIIQLLRFL